MGLPDIEHSDRIVVPAIKTSVPYVRRKVTDLAEDLGADRATCERIALAVSEAATNAVIHAYGDHPGRIRVTVTREGDDFEVVVADDGRGIRTRSDSPGLGMGLGIIAEVTDRLAIKARGGEGTELRMGFTVGSREPRMARG
jgi:serine/threonine-protein kinase RsbW/stage II sporulation protein AB (anti-sigma F factor)